MILSRDKKPAQPIEIDLAGPQGNAYALFAIARTLGRQLGYSGHKIKCIIDEMKLTSYEGLLYTFDREFGHIVTLWK